MVNFKYYDPAKIYFGLATTINPNAGINENQTPQRIVVLKKSKNTYIPIKNYEYYYCKSVVSIANYMDINEIGLFISEDKINEVISRTGLLEAKVIGMEKDTSKVLKKYVA
ncbi:MAG: hypothetical protein E7168_02840 [Firmicutes bacterium]|nr:hypothetical protein [Bacillota bacterium]